MGGKISLRLNSQMSFGPVSTLNHYDVINFWWYLMASGWYCSWTMQQRCIQPLLYGRGGISLDRHPSYYFENFCLCVLPSGSDTLALGVRIPWNPPWTFELKGDKRSRTSNSYLVDPASSHMLVSKIKPCMSKYKQLYSETANGSLYQLLFIWWFLYYWITVVILELIHTQSPDFWKGCIY